MIAENKILEIIDKIAIGYQPDKVILFGSYASGKANEDSDLDLLIVKDSLLTRPERTANVRKLLFGSGLPIDIIVYTPYEIEKSKVDKHSFIYEILNTGKTLYERSN